MLVLYSSSGGHGKVGMVDVYGWCCIVLVVDMVRLGWWMLMLELYSSSGGHGKVGIEWMFMLVLYSSSGGQGKVGMVDAYVGAV